MPLKLYRCPCCREYFKTKADNPLHCGNEHAEEVLTAPQAVFMEKTDKDHGKSKMVGQEKILKERARTHSRTVEINDLIEMNTQEDSLKNGWLKEDGKVRKKIDDL